MKSRMWTGITAMAIFTLLSIPVQLAAQEHHETHLRYKLIDLGTFGGPHS